MQSGPIIISSGTNIAISPAMLKEVRGSLFTSLDRRFTTILLLNLILLIALILLIKKTELPPVKVTVIEEMPTRFAKLIVEKPIPKKDKSLKSNKSDSKSKSSDNIESQKSDIAQDQPKVKHSRSKKAAQKSVAKRAAKTEQKVRTVGVLGMLTGTGTTAKGPSVTNVLGNMKHQNNRLQDLEKALSNMSGLQNHKTDDIITKKLVKSKEMSVDRRENIDALISGVEVATTTTLAKKGNFVIQRPESIEGAGSSSAKRDNSAVNKVVSSHKVSIRMTYEKYLKRIPDLSGKLTIRFTISASGKITNIQILENSTGSAELERDIKRKIKMWRFPAIPEGDATVTYPFIFRPS